MDPDCGRRRVHHRQDSPRLGYSELRPRVQRRGPGRICFGLPAIPRAPRSDWPNTDCSAAELLEPDCRFIPLFDAVSSYVNGVELNLVSVQDSNDYADSGVNWRVAEGYGTVLAAQAAGLPIRLNCPVMLIDHRGKRLAIETAVGTVTADAVILTVPTPVIAAQGIRFRPELTDKVAAASVLPLGLADKLVMAVEAPELLPMDGHLIGNSNKTATGSYHLRPFGRPLIEGFFGGRLAHALEAAGPGALFDFAVAEPVELFGSGIRARLRPLVETGWGRDPFARGSYSYALPGHADARSTLATPLDGRVFFCWRGVLAARFHEAHGAYLTGIEAAGEVIRLRPRGI
ncbi:MAG: FAD-dependent oxidoreductase [Pseudomonadota bacterium]|nr:FAD-dependent oxidoreductase [Pseudomonadota bacterium]